MTIREYTVKQDRLANNRMRAYFGYENYDDAANKKNKKGIYINLDKVIMIIPNEDGVFQVRIDDGNFIYTDNATAYDIVDALNEYHPFVKVEEVVVTQPQ